MLEIWSQWSCGLMISMHKCSSFFTSTALNSIHILKDSTNVSDIEDEKHRFWLYLHMHWKCPITVNGEWNVIQEAVHSYINFHLITCTLYSIYSTHPTRQHYILGDVKPFKIALLHRVLWLDYWYLACFSSSYKAPKNNFILLSIYLIFWISKE